MPSPLRLQILAFAVIRTVVNTMHRMIYPFLTVFARGLGVDVAALSLALTSRSLVGTVSTFLAVISDRRGRKVGLLVSLALFLAGLLVVMIWPTFWAFLLALALTTTGKYAFDPSMQAYLGDRVPYQKRGRALAVTELGWSLAFVGGVPLMGLLIARWGWAAPFKALFVLAALASFAILWLMPRDQPLSEPAHGFWRGLGKVLAYAPARAGLAVGLLASAANEVINLIFGVWMEESFGLQILALGGTAALIGVAELGGETLVGALVDRLGKRRAVAIGLLANCLAALSFLWPHQHLTSALVSLFLFYISFEFQVVSSIPLMTGILPTARATLMACNVAGYSLGRALGALVALPLYHWGVAGSAGAALLFNGLALLALTRVQSEGE